MADEVKTKLTVEGADAIRELESVTRAEGKHAESVKASARAADQSGDASRRAGDSAAEASNKKGLLASATDRLAASFSGLAASFAGAVGLHALYDGYIQRLAKTNEYLQRQIALTSELAEARLNYVALQGVEDPQAVQQLDAAAAVAGRNPAEVYRVAGVFKSQFPNASDADLATLIQQTAAAGQLTDAPLQALAGGLSTLYRETGNAQSAGNILQEAIQQAGEADPGRLAAEIGKFIGVGREIGGLDVGEAAGFASAGTGLGLPNEIATTGLKNVLFAIRGKGTPDGNALLDELDVDRDNVLEALQQIARLRSEGRIDPAGLESIGGREAAPVFAALSDPTKLANFTQSVLAVDRAENYSGSIAADKAGTLFTPGSIQSFNLLAKQAKSQTQAIQGNSVRAAESGAATAIVERELARAVDAGEITPADSERILSEFNAQIAMGKTPAEAAAIAEQERAADLALTRNPLTGRSEDLLSVGRFGGGLLPLLVGYDTNPLSGIDRARSRSDFLEGPVQQGLNLGPQIPNQTIIINENGTRFIGAGDPRFDDQDGRDRE